MHSKIDAGELTLLLKEKELFVPAKLVIDKLLGQGKISEAERGFRVLSEKNYFLNPKDAVECAKEIFAEGYILCESNPQEKTILFFPFDQIFEELIELSKEEIVIVSPFISSDFSADLKRFLEPKKSIISIITNSPKSRIVKESVHKKIISNLYEQNFNVKISKKDFHAKIYLFDNKVAIIGSSNFSRKGFFDNYELGVVIFGNKCSMIRKWINRLLE